METRVSVGYSALPFSRLIPSDRFHDSGGAESVNQLDIPSLVSHSLVRACTFVRDCRIKFIVPGLKPLPCVQRGFKFPFYITSRIGDVVKR